MRTRLATLATLTISVLTAACSAAGPTTKLPSGEPAAARPRSQPPVVHVADQDRSTPAPGADAKMAHAGRGAPATPTDPAQADDPAATDDPADAAAGLLIDLLADEGLLVASIDTHLVRDDGDHAQVRVDVAHSPGHGHPVQSRYLLELARNGHRWRLANFSEPG